MSAERWLPVVGFEGLYEVSDLGRVRSLPRYIEQMGRWGKPMSRWMKGGILALGPHTGGYNAVHLYKDGRQRATVLHIVVAEAFLGPRPAGMEVLHNDGDKKNCAVGNLRYGTKLENEADKELHGTRLRGEKHVSAKLTEADVKKIRASVGIPQQDLADHYGCTFSNISAIQLRKSWKHVD